MPRTCCDWCDHVATWVYENEAACADHRVMLSGWYSASENRQATIDARAEAARESVR